MLHWVRNVIHVRKAHPAFGLGDLKVVPTNHESVLAFVRSYAGSSNQWGDAPERILCVFSFAHNPVSVTLDLSEFAGRRLNDLFGGGEFPTVAADGSVALTLATQSFYWLKIGQPAAEEVY